MFRGFAVGVMETVPGVSGSTVAMILGVYEKLIENLSLLTTKERKRAYPFLFVFCIGMVIGFGCSLFFIDLLLTNYRMPTLIFFVGIIFGFLPYLGRDTLELAHGRLSIRHFSIFIIFLSLVAFGQSLNVVNELDVGNLSAYHYVFLISVGFIASTALVLPGISGALILTIFGVYEFAKDALLQLQIPIVLSIGSGVFLGVLISSKFIRFLLQNYKVETYCAMVGLVTGSIYAILHHVQFDLNLPMMISSMVTFFLGVSVSIVLMER